MNQFASSPANVKGCSFSSVVAIFVFRRRSTEELYRSLCSLEVTRDPHHRYITTTTKSLYAQQAQAQHKPNMRRLHKDGQATVRM